MTDPHWLTLFDPADGEPYGEPCYCPRGYDHDGAGNPNGLGAEESDDDD